MPENDPEAYQPKRGVRRFLASVASGMAGTVGPGMADALKNAGAEDMSLDELKLLLGQPERLADTEAKTALADLRRRTPGSRGGGANDPHKRLQFLERATTGEPGAINRALDPDVLDAWEIERDQLRKKLGKPEVKSPTAAPSGGAPYAKIAEDGKGGKMGFNSKTKKWESIK